MMSFADEHQELLTLINYKNYRRYNNDLYALYDTDGTGQSEWKFEYNICEFVWGFCKNPCYAKRLTKALEDDVQNFNGFLKVLARSNNNIKPSNLYHKWDTAIDVADKETNERPSIVYSTESSHLWSNKKVFCNSIDGELWHGILMTKDTVDNLESIRIDLQGTNSRNMEWKSDYLWHVSDVMMKCKTFGEDNNLVLFTPFVHPVILIGDCVQLAVSFSFTDGRLPKESQIKIVYGICNSALTKWLEKSTGFKTQLTPNRKLIVNIPNNTVDEVTDTR